jgi:hypothetical protein
MESKRKGLPKGGPDWEADCEVDHVTQPPGCPSLTTAFMIQSKIWGSTGPPSFSRSFPMPLLLCFLLLRKKSPR